MRITFLTLLAGCALTFALTLDSRAGSYEILQLGDGADPGTYRVSLVVTADTLTPCPDDRCAWCCGGHWVTISPAPVDAIHAWEEVPVEGGLRIYWELSNPDAGYCWLDLDPAVSYVLTDGLTWGDWQAWQGLPATCGTSDICRGEDDAYPPYEIIGPAVSDTPGGWSALKAQFQGPEGGN